MKMKVFSCVMLAVLVVGGLALGESETSGFSINCVHTITATGDLDFDNPGSPARDPEHSGHVLCDGYVELTFKLNCDCQVTFEADGKFTGAGGDSMDATWYGIASYNRTDWFSTTAGGLLTNWWDYGDWDKSPPGDVYDQTDVYYDNNWDGVGYARVKVGVERNGLGDRADSYYATIEWTVTNIP